MNKTLQNLIVAERVISAAKDWDWMQMSMHQGEPCFHVAEDFRFCGRAKEWEGHEDLHKFTSLAEMLESFRAPASITAFKVSEITRRRDACNQALITWCRARKIDSIDAAEIIAFVEGWNRRENGAMPANNQSPEQCPACGGEVL